MTEIALWMTAENRSPARPHNVGMARIHRPPDGRLPPPLSGHPKLLPHAPVIGRGDQEFQVGLDPRTALIFTGAGFGELLTALNGSHTLAAVRSTGRRAGLTLSNRSIRLCAC